MISLSRRIIQNLLIVTLIIMNLGTSVCAQADDLAPTPINAENIVDLHPIYQLDFSQLPPEIETASGQFVMSADGSRIVSFGNQAEASPFSQGIIWEEGQIVGMLALEGDSITRELTDDGQCLYVGYQGHIRAYRLDMTEAIHEFMYVALPNEDDYAVNFWQAEGFTCAPDVYVEVAALDGQLYRGEVVNDVGFVLMDELFILPDVTTAARVGRIPPPLALTIDFDGNLYRWDMNRNAVTGQVNVGEIAMFGKLNASGSHYMWLSPAHDGLYLADFANESTTQITPLDDVYLSHMLLTHSADVVIGIDPYDARGTVSAWDVATGERLELGKYRTCDRTQPELVQLSRDGATVVIGCDLGLEVWRTE